MAYMQSEHICKIYVYGRKKVYNPCHPTLDPKAGTLSSEPLLWLLILSENLHLNLTLDIHAAYMLHVPKYAKCA